MHPDKAHVATGQGGPSPFVIVWNSACESTQTKARLQLGEDKKGVSQASLSRAEYVPRLSRSPDKKPGY